jgi:sorting nexin-25
LGEARRLRADVDREQRMAKTALDQRLQADQVEKDADLHIKRARKYVKRLERARLEVDARITVLSRSPGKVRASF